MTSIDVAGEKGGLDSDAYMGKDIHSTTKTKPTDHLLLWKLPGALILYLMLGQD